MAKVFTATSLLALGKNKKLRGIVESAVEGNARYVLVPVLQVRDPKHGWPADEDGIELMNSLAAAGWNVSASLANAVVMERPTSDA